MGVTLALVAVEASAGPKFSKIHENKNEDQLFKVLKKAQYLAAAMSLIIGLILIMISPAINVFLNIESINTFTIVLSILIFGYILNGYFAPIGTLFQMTFYERLSLRAYIGGIVLGGPLLAFLMVSYGEVGLATGCMLIYLFRGVFLSQMFNKVFKL